MPDAYQTFIWDGHTWVPESGWYCPTDWKRHHYCQQGQWVTLCKLFDFGGDLVLIRDQALPKCKRCEAQLGRLEVR